MLNEVTLLVDGTYIEINKKKREVFDENHTNILSVFFLEDRVGLVLVTIELKDKYAIIEVAIGLVARVVDSIIISKHGTAVTVIWVVTCGVEIINQVSLVMIVFNNSK